MLGIAALALVLVVGPLVGFHTYQADRLTAFLDPGAIPATQISDALYQQHESRDRDRRRPEVRPAARSRRTRRPNFVPLNSTDFIFAALG